MRRRSRPGIGAIVVTAGALAAATTSCQAFVDSEAKAGIGAPCAKDTDCQGSECKQGVCTITCSGHDVCPDGTFCSSAGLCELPLRAGFIYPGNPNEQQWSRGHEEGRKANESLSYLVETRVWSDRPDPGAARVAIDEAVAAGMDVVFLASPALAPAGAEKAQQYPDVRFFTAGGRQTSGNHGTYYGRLYEPWYLAGKAAATESDTNRLGMIASYVTPAVIRDINAFTLGALSANPGVVVQVEWLNNWFDPASDGDEFDERNFAAELVADGCDVIAHMSFNGFAVDFVDEQPSGTTLSIGANVADACDGEDRCFATVYWNWAPLYRRILDSVHLGDGNNFFNEDMRGQANQSVPNFSTTLGDLAAALQPDVDALVQANGVGPAFAGTFCSTTMDPCFDDMAQVTDEDLANMCWLVEGVIEKDMAGMDVAAQVPPEGDCAPD